MKLKKKVVHFNDKIIYHYIISWKFAYKEARKSSWETYTRDRIRFNKRISHIENILTPILDIKHREYILKNKNNVS